MHMCICDVCVNMLYACLVCVCSMVCMCVLCVCSLVCMCDSAGARNTHSAHYTCASKDQEDIGYYSEERSSSCVWVRAGWQSASGNSPPDSEMTYACETTASLFSE